MAGISSLKTMNQVQLRQGPRPTTEQVTLAALLNVDIPEWVSQGICAQTDPDAFHPEKGASTEPAKRICHECPVKAECLEWALEHDERFGIWGGASSQERRKIQHERAVIAGADPA